MPECVFCRIVAGRGEASFVFDDDVTLAFMDIEQQAKAHVLVIPKVHVETIDLLPPDVAAQLMQTVVRVAQGLRAAYDPAEITVWQSNGAAAGQDVPHVHMHLLTREPNDGLLRVHSTSPSMPDRAELDRRAAIIHTVIDDERIRGAALLHATQRLR